MRPAAATCQTRASIGVSDHANQWLQKNTVSTKAA